MKPTERIRAVAFDAYGTLFDVYSVGALAEQLFPGKGEALTALWRLKQIEYSFLRTLSGRYKPFLEITEDGLVYSAKKLGLALNESQRRQLMNQYACLSPFPENLGALKALRALGLPMAVLSNGTPQMLDVAIKSAGMTGLFDHVLSVDAVHQYKTADAAYQLGPDAFGVPAKDILFVSSNGWDAAGATWFGYTTFWINRAQLPTEELGVTPTAVGQRLTDIVEFVQLRCAPAVRP
ncbi:haloacid dehalogenase type II [Aromatoleum petrolei]|uniref:(S)-2-haloacid dehalogenase n=1 Tax=Aromatoleum petrolei TaxID=76116 RepID=A0ABX1MNF0_9RHOO|nr:haloacid dehalogenase type II [Aromatoleum petrolei]NMF87870.1 haloacid dehalogenase type II [Aromatoleum petrolei]QTQ35263.1 2-haloacid dehalogenase family protein [Aromatoleum petrolei]